MRLPAPPMAERDVRRGIAKGLQLAHARAHRWSDGFAWLNETGAENLLQVSIAEEIYKAAVAKPVMLLEPTLTNLLRVSHRRMKPDARRVDIGLYYQTTGKVEPSPFCVIEIKKWPRAYKEDLRKIRMILRESPTARYAFFVIYFQHNSHKNRLALRAYRLSFKVRVNQACGKSFNCVPVKSLWMSHLYGDGTSAEHHAGSVVFRLSRAD